MTFSITFSEVVFYFLKLDWLLRLFKSSENSESQKSVVPETENHRKQKQNCAQSAYPKVSEEAHTPKSPDGESANEEREPTFVQPEQKKINTKVIITRLKRKLHSVESANDELITENRKLKTKLISTERAHADEIQAMMWNHEDMESGFADFKLEQDIKTEQALAQYRMEISQLGEINSQLRKQNQDLGVELLESQKSLGSLSLSLEQREEDLISLEKQFIDLNISYEDVKTVQDGLAFELAQSKLEHEKSDVMYRDLISEMENQILRLSREKEDISIDLTISQINSDYLSFTLDENELAIETLEERVIVLQYRIMDRYRQWRGLCMKRTDLKRKNDQLHDLIAVLEEKLEKEIAMRLEMEEVHAHELTSIRDFSSVRHRQQQEKVKDLKDQIEELLDEVDRLEDASYDLPDFYAILGFEKKKNRDLVSNEEINAAYKAAQFENHPDRINQQFSEFGPAICKRAVDRANKRSKQIERAKEILGFSTRIRAAYDRWLDMTELNSTIQRQQNYNEFNERERKMKEEIRLAKEHHQ